MLGCDAVSSFVRSVRLKHFLLVQLPAAFRWVVLPLAASDGFMLPVPNGLAEEANYSPALLAVGAGYYDFVKTDDTAVDFRLEYRSDLELWKLQPWLGLEVTTDRAVYSAGGFFVDLELDPHWVLTPSAGVGAYYDGDGKNLGSKVAFRLQAELSYRFQDDSRLTFAFSHLSNARIGGNNPGAEILTLYYMIPLDHLF